MPKEPSTEINRIDARFDSIEHNIRAWIQSLPKGLAIIDLDIGGGQLAKIAESCYNDVIGYAQNEFFKNIAVSKEKLVEANYKVSGVDGWNDKAEFLNMKEKFIQNIQADWTKLAVIGNPAYTIGKGRTPIYDVSLDTLSLLDLAGLLYIIPTKWMSRNGDSLGIEVRKSLRKLGIKTIVINPLDLFKDTGVITETCTVICERGYKGDIKIQNNEGTESFTITQAEFDDRIWPFFDQEKKDLLMKHKQTENTRLFFDKSSDNNVVKKKYLGRWIPKTSYQKENYNKDPINKLKPLKTDADRTTTDMVAGGVSFDNEQDCQTYCDRWNSYLFTKPIQWHFKNTRMSTTLDKPQLNYVPNFIKNDPKKIYTDADIYDMGNYTDEEIRIIEDDR